MTLQSHFAKSKWLWLCKMAKSKPFDFAMGGTNSKFVPPLALRCHKKQRLYSHICVSQCHGQLCKLFRSSSPAQTHVRVCGLYPSCLTYQEFYAEPSELTASSAVNVIRFKVDTCTQTVYAPCFHYYIWKVTLHPVIDSRVIPRSANLLVCKYVHVCACGLRIAKEGCLLPLSSLSSEEESNVTPGFHSGPSSHDPKMSFLENIHCLQRECIYLQVTKLLSSKQK